MILTLKISKISQHRKSSSGFFETNKVIEFSSIPTTSDSALPPDQTSETSRLLPVTTTTTITATTATTTLSEDYKTRFANVARLYDGDASLERLSNSHICVSYLLSFKKRFSYYTHDFIFITTVGHRTRWRGLVGL